MRTFIIAIIVLIVFDGICSAHPGRTDSSGGHMNRSTGTYHFHGTPPYRGPSVSTPRITSAPRTTPRITSRTTPRTTTRGIANITPSTANDASPRFSFVKYKTGIRSKDLEVLRELRRAIAEFEQAIGIGDEVKDPPSPDEAEHLANAKLRLAKQYLYKLNRPDKAEVLLEEIIEQFPDTDAATEATAIQSRL